MENGFDDRVYMNIYPGRQRAPLMAREGIKLVKRGGVDLNAVDNAGRNALYYALRIDDSLAATLIKYGCDVTVATFKDAVLWGRV